jgi:hypothetical protein
MKHEIIPDILAVSEKVSESPYCDTCDFAAKRTTIYVDESHYLMEEGIVRSIERVIC